LGQKIRQRDATATERKEKRLREAIFFIERFLKVLKGRNSIAWGNAPSQEAAILQALKGRNNLMLLLYFALSELA
jgi:hypothetical protein